VNAQVKNIHTITLEAIFNRCPLRPSPLLLLSLMIALLPGGVCYSS